MEFFRDEDYFNNLEYDGDDNKDVEGEGYY